MSALRVVLVDDHEVVRAGVRALVEASPGIEVVAEAGNGADAITCALEHRPDVVIMDVFMPVLDGATATERICRADPTIKILALTACEDRWLLAHLLQAGASGYVLKRAAADELVRAVRTVAAGESYVDPLLGGAISESSASSVAASATAVSGMLSEREEEVVRRIAWGETNREAAEHLGVSLKTVEAHRARIARKLGVKTRVQMVRYALWRGWLTNEGRASSGS